MYKEYVLWGNPPGSNEQALLQTQYNNAPITDKQTALLAQLTLEKHYGCTAIVIQELDGELPDFSKVF